jgi:predicted enzyme related to lactoylglutathione lyase
VPGKPADIEPMPDIRESEVAGTWVQLAEDEDTTGNWTLRIGVSDLDAERQRLEDLGIRLGDTHTVPEVVSYFNFYDPDGNRLSYCQELGTS